MLFCKTLNLRFRGAIGRLILKKEPEGIIPKIKRVANVITLLPFSIQIKIIASSQGLFQAMYLLSGLSLRCPGSRAV